MSKQITLKKETLLEMSDLISLQLAEDRVDMIRETTEAWYNNANALVEKMMDLKYWEVIPVSVIRVND